jgi:cytochrome c oxidase cbb3-type subunit 3
VEQKLASDRLAAKAASNPITEQMLLKLSTEPGFVAEGKKLFEDQTKCAQCHGPLGHGITAAGTPALGPNLTDDHWIYGSKPMDVYTTILKGQAPDLKRRTMGGMQAWDYMGTDFVLKTTAYVLSIKNTNVAGGKAPEAYAVKEP